MRRCGVALHCIIIMYILCINAFSIECIRQGVAEFPGGDQARRIRHCEKHGPHYHVLSILSIILCQTNLNQPDCHSIRTEQSDDVITDLFSSTLPMFVPSLSWQNDGIDIYIYKWRKKWMRRCIAVCLHDLLNLSVSLSPRLLIPCTCVGVSIEPMHLR